MRKLSNFILLFVIMLVVIVVSCNLPINDLWDTFTTQEQIDLGITRSEYLEYCRRGICELDAVSLAHTGYDTEGFDAGGYNRSGFDRDGIHRITGASGWRHRIFLAHGLNNNNFTEYHNSRFYNEFVGQCLVLLEEHDGNYIGRIPSNVQNFNVYLLETEQNGVISVEEYVYTINLLEENKQLMTGQSYYLRYENLSVYGGNASYLYLRFDDTNFGIGLSASGIILTRGGAHIDRHGGLTYRAHTHLNDVLEMISNPNCR